MRFLILIIRTNIENRILIYEIWRGTMFFIKNHIMEMVKSPTEAGSDIIKDLVNQIKVVVTLAEQELSTTGNCYTEKGDPLETANYKKLKLTDPFLKIVITVSQKLIKQQVDICEIQFGFMAVQELKRRFLSRDIYRRIIQ